MLLNSPKIVSVLTNVYTIDKTARPEGSTNGTCRRCIFNSGGSKGGARGTRALPLGAQILSISCSFSENLAKSYVGAPPLGSWRPLLREILDPPLFKLSYSTVRSTISQFSCRVRVNRAVAHHS